MDRYGVYKTLQQGNCYLVPKEWLFEFLSRFHGSMHSFKIRKRTDYENISEKKGA